MQTELFEIIEECNRYEKFFTKTLKQLYFIKNNFETESLTFKSTLKKAVIDFRLSSEQNSEGLIEKTLIEYSKSEYYPEKVKPNLT